MRILIIGGTRFIGAAVARHLLQAEHTVAVLNRGQTLHNLPPQIEQITGDMRDLPAADASIRRFKPEVVLHNMVISEQDAVHATTYFRGGIARLIMTSSMDVYQHFGRLIGIEPGDPLPAPADEDAPLRTVWYPYRAQNPDPNAPFYAYDKIPAERHVLSLPDLPATVLRLPMVTGAGDHQRRLLPFVLAMQPERAVYFLSQEYAAWLSTYGFVENVAAAMALATTDQRAAGRIYNVADHIKSIHEMAQATAEALGWRGEIRLVPQASLPEALRAPLPVLQPLAFKADRIRAELGYAPLLTFEEGMARTVAWERDHLPETLTDDQQALLAAQDAVLKS